MTRDQHADSVPAADPAPTVASSAAAVPFGTAVRAWALISLQTFGGPAGQIAVMHRALVDEKRWIGEKRFLHALNYCMLLPGPEAQQLAVYTGWLLHGTRGGLVAGSLFVLPGLVALLLLSWIYVAYGSTTVVASLFAGLAPAVLAVVAQAVVRVGKKALRGAAQVTLAVAAFLALTFFAVPFPFVVVAAGLVGWLIGRWRPDSMSRPSAPVTDGGAPPVIPDDELHGEIPGRRRTLRVLLLGLIAWGVPLLVSVLLSGTGSVFTQMGLFFSGAAVVTFGGAYAVLAYVAQRAVEVFGWLSPTDMVRGLALAETTPGPLIMVVQFVAFLGAYHNPGSLNPWVAAVLASLLVTWVTFVPSFLFVFLGAPYMEKLRGNTHLAAALTGVTSAVVGVIANLGVYFAAHTLFTDTRPASWGPVQLTVPDLSTVQPVACAIAVVATLLLFWWKRNVLLTLAICAALGLVAGLAGLPVS